MRQCLFDQVLESRVQCHIPAKWRHRIRKVDRTVNDKNGELLSSRWNQDINDFLGSNNSCEKRMFFTRLGQTSLEFINNTMPRNISSKTLETIKNVIQKEDILTTASSKQSEKEEEQNGVHSRLPGIIEIDNISREAIGQTEYSLSSDGLWVVTIAVRDYISHILKSAMKAAVPTEIDQVKDPLRQKKRRITSFDILKALDSFTNKKLCFSSRMAWERCISEIDLYSIMDSDTALNDIQDHITNLIVTPSTKRRKITVSTSATKSISAESSVAPTIESYGSMGKGKNLAAMVVRHQQDEESKKRSSPSTCPSVDTQRLKRRPSPSFQNDNSRPPSTIALPDVSKPPSLSTAASVSSYQFGKNTSRPPSALSGEAVESTTGSRSIPRRLSIPIQYSISDTRNSKNFASMMARNNSLNTSPSIPDEGDKKIK